MKRMVFISLLLFAQPISETDTLTIQLPGQSVTINREDFTMPGATLADPYKYEQLVKELNDRLFVAPQNAKWNEQRTIIPEKLGQKLDEQRFGEQFYTYVFSNGPAVINPRVKMIYPKVDSELLVQITEKQIGHYVTYFNAANTNRSYNIGLAAKTINNAVVFPGETFSFNEVVGKRTKEKGYLNAPVIVRGELSEGVGGGICQVSSTLFNAADRAGLQIVKRYSHSRSVPYVLPGRDATVSWYGPDFEFRNQYNQPIIIRATAAGGKMFVSIYSSEMIAYNPRQVPSMSKQLPGEIILSRV